MFTALGCSLDLGHVMDVNSQAPNGKVLSTCSVYPLVTHHAPQPPP